MSHSIIKHKKSFQDGEVIKEAFVEAADSLFRDFKNKPEILSSIKALQLSRSRVTRRCEVMAEDLTRHCEVMAEDLTRHCEVMAEDLTRHCEVMAEDLTRHCEVMAEDLTRHCEVMAEDLTRRCEVMAENLTQRVWKDIADCCECFSLQLDESTDVSDTAQMCIFIRMVFTDTTAKEELLTILPMKEHTWGEDIFQYFKNFIEKTQHPVCKLVSITTDGMPAMVGSENGFISKCREDDAFPDFLNNHCIIHQQALCAKMLSMKEIMDVAMKITCSIRARSLQRQLFRCASGEG